MQFWRQIQSRLENTQAYSYSYDITGTEHALEVMAEKFRRAHDAGGRVFFVGNGGSAGIASHMATDWTKNGRVRSLALNDASALTCMANDFGYENVFARQLRAQATPADCLVAISSSGNSPNILAAVEEAQTIGLRFVMTLSGMDNANKLRWKGDINLWVPSDDYGVIECAHLILLHTMVGRK